MMEVHAHRGDRRFYPENTLSAFESAVEKGADWLELDVHVSQDRELVVFHDAFLSSRKVKDYEGSKPIYQASLEELRTLDVGSVVDPRFPDQKIAPGEGILTLRSVWERFRETEVRLNIELKSIPTLLDGYPRYRDYGELVFEFLRDEVELDRVCIQSFDHLLIERLTQHLPNGDFAVLFGENRMDYLTAVRRAGVRTANLMLGFFEEEDLERLRATGVRTWVYTSNRILEWELLRKWKVDGVVTDDPGGLREFLERE